MLEAALTYATVGLRVLPLHSAPGGVCSCGKPECDDAGKHPRTRNGLTDASADVAVIAEWWRRWPNANVGIRTGPESGIAVLDLDPRHDGIASLEALERKHGRLPQGPQALTGSGGQHRYFSYPTNGVRNSAGALGDGLDVRGDGGYVVAPPSVHANGNQYKWLRDLDVGLPDPGVLFADAMKRRNGAARKVDEIIPEGKRRAAMLTIAGKLKRAGLTGTEILPTLRELNRRCRPPLDERELESVAFESTIEPDPDTAIHTIPVAEPQPIDDAVAVFSRWLLLPDVEPVYALLGAVAANYLPGAPVWLILVSPPSNGKTELLGSLARLPDVHPASTLTEASLLSGTPGRERALTAKGGLLREIGDFGIVVLKDMGSLLSMRPDDKAEVFAALREVFDGSYVRYVGADGGRQLSWTGKLGLVAGATPVLDRHHGVLSVMGERFLLCRLPEALEAQAERALAHTGELEAQMRRELAEAVAGLFAAERREPRPLADNERRELVGLAALVARARSPVERDRHTREVELVPGAEGPARLAVTLERLLAGLDALGCERQLALRVLRRVGLDSMPALRRQLLEQLCATGEPVTTTALAIAVHTPTNTVRRTLEDLAAYRLVDRTKQEQGKADLWQMVEWAQERFR
jgi:hypothetical protein